MRIFNGVKYFSAQEMANSAWAGSRQSWSRLARLKKVPAVKFSAKWWFNPQEVEKAIKTQSGYKSMESVNNGREETNNLAGLE